MPSCSWACKEIGSGVQNGYLPSNLDHEADTEGTDLQEIIEDYHEYNSDFNLDAALRAIPEGETDRGDMFNVLALGLGLIDEPADDPFELADELADLDILYGHDRDGDGVSNPYTRPDADPDSTMTNAQLAAFLDRIPINNGNGGNPGGGDPGNNPGGPGGDPGNNPPPDPDTPPCSTGLLLTSGLRMSFLSELRWMTLVDIRANGPPGEPWPPHPGVPGGSEYLVVAKSPVWPSVDPQAQWHVSSLDGCLWEAVSVRTGLSQLVPWQSEHRTLIENEAAARPRAGFDTYLNRWDNLSATQQSQAQQYHVSRSVHASCDFADTLGPSLAESRCSWELPWAGVWDWTVSVCFEGWTQDRTYHECAVLDHGVEWFLSVLDYTQQITLLNGEPAGG